MTRQEFIIRRAFRVADQASRFPYKWRNVTICWLKLALRWAEKYGPDVDVVNIKNLIHRLGA